MILINILISKIYIGISFYFYKLEMYDCIEDITCFSCIEIQVVKASLLIPKSCNLMMWIVQCVY